MAQNSSRSATIERIKSYLARAADSASTESEMAMALAKAKKLMDEHDITDDDINFGGEEVAKETRVKTDHDSVRDLLATPIGRFCHCVAYNEGMNVITFVGLESEALFAHWLLDMLGDFVFRRLEQHPSEIDVRRLTRSERASFLSGCVSRIIERMQALTPPRPVGNGRDLVLARQSLIETFLRENGIKLREPFKLFHVDPRSYAAGRRAGNDANFSRPIDQETSIKGLLK